MPSEMDELDEAGKAPGGAAVKFAIAAGITHRVRANMAGRALSRNPDAGAQTAGPARDGDWTLSHDTPRAGPEPAWDSPEAREARQQRLLDIGLDPELVEGLMLADLSHGVPPEEAAQGRAAGAEQAPAAQRAQEQQLMLDLEMPGP